MNFTVYDQIEGFKHFELEADAQAALPLAQSAFLNQESYRFNIALVVTEGENTTWMAAQESDPESGEYKVFNNMTGQYEDFASLSSAKARNEELKTALLLDARLDRVYEYVAPALIPQTPQNLVAFVGNVE
jgi:hypothetical protein